MATTTLELLILAKDEASNVFEQVGKSVEKSTGHLDKLKAAGNIALAGAGVAAIDFAKKSVDAYTESRVAQTKLEDAYKRFPGLADVSIEAMRKLNDETMRKTGYDDDALAVAEASLASYGLTGDQIAKLTPLVADYAAKTGTDLTTATEQVGKAMLGQGRALKTIGIDFHDTKSVAGNFAEVTAGLTEKVGGLATTMGQTAEGKTKILAATFEDLQKKLGEKLVPILSTVTDKLTAMVDWISANSAWLGPLVGTVLALAAAMKVWSVIQAIINTEMWMSPIPWIIAGIVALVAAIVILVTHWDAVKKAGAAAWEWIKGAWSSAGAWFSGIGDKIAGVFSGLPGKLKAIGLDIANALTWPIRTEWNGLASLWNGSLGKVHVSIPSWVPGVGGKDFQVPSLPEIPSFALGGIVPATPGGRLVRVAEAGQDEAIIPLPKGGHRLGGAPVINIYVTEAVNPQATAMQVSRRLAAQFV